MKVENGVTNFAVYEDATEYYGMAEVTLPEIASLTEEVKGAGISGVFNGAFVGHLEAMTLTLNFRSVTKDAIKLLEPRNHQIDLRASQQAWDNSAGRFQQTAVNGAFQQYRLAYAGAEAPDVNPPTLSAADRQRSVVVHSAPVFHVGNDAQAQDIEAILQKHDEELLQKIEEQDRNRENDERRLTYD